MHEVIKPEMGGTIIIIIKKATFAGVKIHKKKRGG